MRSSRLAHMSGLPLLAALALTTLPLAPVSAQSESSPPAVGEVAPAFSVTAATRYGILQDQVSLSDFQGKTVVLAFFPRARTQGCTIQMHAYRDQYSELFKDGQDVVLVAMSMDSPEDLYSWAKDDQFQFLMASDQSGTVAEAYGASQGRFASRYLFVIGPDGKIAETMIPFAEVDPTSYEALAAAIDAVAAQ